MMHPLDASDQVCLQVPYWEPHFYKRAALPVATTRTNPLSPRPSISPTLRNFPVTPQSPEMAAFESLHSLSRGGALPQEANTRPRQLTSRTPVDHVEELHDRSIQYLRSAKEVAVRGRLPRIPDASLNATGTTDRVQEPSAPPSFLTAWNSKDSLAQQTKNRRKWLPPSGTGR